MRIIPAIDILGGRLVRLEMGNYDKATDYGTDPVIMAKKFEEAGLEHLHLVDLDGAKSSKVINLNVLSRITAATSLKVDFGGGVKTSVEVDRVLAAGARQVTGGSIAARDREVFTSWIEKYGPERIILGADVNNGKIMVQGWQEDSSIDLFEFLSYYVDLGIQSVICTDIRKDGMLKGPAFDLYDEILNEFPGIDLIASGGISSTQDFSTLKSLGLSGAIVGKAIYEGRVNLEELKSI